MMMIAVLISQSVSANIFIISLLIILISIISHLVSTIYSIYNIFQNRGGVIVTIRSV